VCRAKKEKSCDIVGTIRVFKRITVIEGRHFLTGAIGEVAVHPDHRQKGIASKLLKVIT